MRRAITCFFLLSMVAHAATEREIAEWVLRWEGEVTIQGHAQPVKDVDQIPPGDIHITAIDLTGS